YGAWHTVRQATRCCEYVETLQTGGDRLHRGTSGLSGHAIQDPQWSTDGNRKSMQVPLHDASCALAHASSTETSLKVTLPSASKNDARNARGTLMPTWVSIDAVVSMLRHDNEIEYAPSDASVANAPYDAVLSGVVSLPPIRSSMPSGSVTIALITSTSVSC